jgi:phosphinothricin acetyltransferase
MDEVTIGEMQPDDWESVRAIYEQGLTTGNASFETEAPTWPVWDERHLRHSRLVARAAGQVVA